MLQVIRSPKIYDVCIIGSGAAGGAAAKVLTEGGVSVVMLEAGPPLDPAKGFKEHLWPYVIGTPTDDPRTEPAKRVEDRPSHSAIVQRVQGFGRFRGSECIVG